MSGDELIRVGIGERGQEPTVTLDLCALAFEIAERLVSDPTHAQDLNAAAAVRLHYPNPEAQETATARAVLAVSSALAEPFAIPLDRALELGQDLADIEGEFPFCEGRVNGEPCERYALDGYSLCDVHTERAGL